MCDHLQDKKKLQKKAKRKWLNIPVIKQLLGLNSPLKSKYYTTLYCSSSIKAHEGKTSSRYCKRPWCNICNPIRVAIRLNSYQAQLMQLSNLQMTTLTAPNCTAEMILPTFKYFRKVFTQFRDTYKKRTGYDFKGVYNLECTVKCREEVKMFHPHIHIIHEGLPCKIVPGKEWKAIIKGGDTSTGQNLKFVNELIVYWLKKNPLANIGGQDCRNCTSLIEGFKYTNKSIFKIKLNGKNQTIVPVHQLDLIYNALVGVRCFQPFGIKKAAIEEDKEFERLESYNVESKPDGVYKWAKNDWHHKVDSTPLCDFIPNEKENLLYDTLAKNKHYKPRLQTHGGPVHQFKGVRELPEHDKQKEHPSALQYLLSNRGKKSSITSVDKY